MDENKTSLAVPAAIIIFILVIAGAVYYRSNIDPSDNLAATSAATATSSSELAKIIQPAEGINLASLRDVDLTDKIRGEANAPIKVIVYTDLECPACKYFHNQLRATENNYVNTGKVAIIYRPFPLESLHPVKAVNEFMAAECVSELGGNEKYLQFIDKIFEITPSNNGLDPAKLSETAQTLGVDIKSFDSCLTAKKYNDKIQAGVQEAITLGAQGTPFFVIVAKDQKIPVFGGLPAERLAAAFDLLLADQ